MADASAVAPWDLRAPAPPRYSGDTSVFSPALRDARTRAYVLGRRLQGTALTRDPGKEVALFTFLPNGSDLARLEGLIEAGCDHAQLHPGTVYSADGAQAGGLYFIRGEVGGLGRLRAALAAQPEHPWCLMMASACPDGTPIAGGPTVEHVRVVVPFAPGTPAQTIGDPMLSVAAMAGLRSALVSAGGRAWEHADFNGYHLATDVLTGAAEALRARIAALGGTLESAHNLGATRFIPQAVNVEAYPVEG
jgi:hypothetical protein